MNPKVSIIIPAYNKAELTVKTVDSVLRQTYNNIEIIVVDDGSTDDTHQRLISYGDKIVYIHKENGGACSARNLGIKAAKGEYIGILDCDDLYLPEKVEISVKYLEENMEAGFVSTVAYLIDETEQVQGIHCLGRNKGTGWITKKLLAGNFVCNSTVIVRKSCLDLVGLFDETIFFPADWDMWLRLSENFKAGYINVPLSMYRTTGSYLARHLDQSKKEELIVLEKAFKRNTILREYLKNKAVSNVYRRYSLNYLFCGDINKSREFLIMSLRKYLLSPKTLFLFLCTIVCGGRLSSVQRFFKRF
ncbi:MAG: glycosyltransferase [Candidatus Omnitrophica bacterium]|nr:glycosyltransferase [Candidatus Omnitrophota bacterium]